MLFEVELYKSTKCPQQSGESSTLMLSTSTGPRDDRIDQRSEALLLSLDLEDVLESTLDCRECTVASPLRVDTVDAITEGDAMANPERIGNFAFNGRLLDIVYELVMILGILSCSYDFWNSECVVCSHLSIMG